MPYLVALGYAGLFIMIGAFLRSKVKFFQDFLVPSSLIGGLLGFLVINFLALPVPTMGGVEYLKTGAFGTLVFHFFAVGFVGIGLVKTVSAVGQAASTAKVVFRGTMWMAIMFTLGYAIYGLMGYSIFSAWHAIAGGDSPLIGILLGPGYAQGPGQTMAYATIMESHGISNAVNIGMTFVACGFFASMFIGVPLARYGLRKGWGGSGRSTELPDYFVTGVYTKDQRGPSATHVTYPGNIDTFALHLGLFFFVYFLAYCVGICWARVMPAVIAPLGIGFVFMWALIIAKGVRIGAGRLNVEHMLDDQTIRRFTGVCVDFMIAAVFMSIQFSAIQGMLVPIILTVVAATLITLWFSIYFGSRTPELGLERTLCCYGTMTGTIATGLLVLRIVDADFKTTVAEEAGLWSFITVSSIAIPIMYIAMPLAAVPEVPLLGVSGLTLALGIFALTIPAMLILLKVFKLWGKPQF